MKAEGGVGRGMLLFGDRRWWSMALSGVAPPELIDAGVASCGLLTFEVKTSGAGEHLRSASGDFGGTRGGISGSSRMPPVSSLSKGLGVAPGLRIGDSGLPQTLGGSEQGGKLQYWVCTGEGPVTQAIMASPNGPDRQFVPGALQERSWPKASYEGLRRGGLPGMVAEKPLSACCLDMHRRI